MADTRLQELAENQDCSPDAMARAEAPARVEPAYRRDNLPNLDSLPVAIRLKAGLLTGLSTVGLSMALIWALVAAAALATAQPDTLHQSLSYIVWFPVSMLVQPELWLWVAIIMSGSFWGMLKPRTRSPEGISLFVWLALFFALYSSTLFDGRLDGFTKLIGGVLLGFHSAFVAAIFFLAYRKVRTTLVKKIVKDAKGDHGSC